MKPTPQQEAFTTALVDTDDNLLLEARAGTGKTASLVMGAKALSPLVQITALAFNKRNAEDLAAKMPDNADCRTFNSAGHRAWMKHIGKRVKLNTRKTWDIAKKIGLSGEFPDLARAIGLIKANSVGPGNSAAMRPLDEGTLTEMCDNNALDYGKHKSPGAILMRVMEMSIAQAWQGDIDFDDQLYMSAIYKAPFERADILMVDE